MNGLLLTLVVMAGLNTMSVFVQAMRGRFEPVTMQTRMVEWVYTLTLGVWALWLLATN